MPGAAGCSVTLTVFDPPGPFTVTEAVPGESSHGTSMTIDSCPLTFDTDQIGANRAVAKVGGCVNATVVLFTSRGKAPMIGGAITPCTPGARPCATMVASEHGETPPVWPLAALRKLSDVSAGPGGVTVRANICVNVPIVAVMVSGPAVF